MSRNKNYFCAFSTKPGRAYEKNDIRKGLRNSSKANVRRLAASLRDATAGYRFVNLLMSNGKKRQASQILLSSISVCKSKALKNRKGFLSLAMPRPAETDSIENTLLHNKASYKKSSDTDMPYISRASVTAVQTQDAFSKANLSMYVQRKKHLVPFVENKTSSSTLGLSSEIAAAVKPMTAVAYALSKSKPLLHEHLLKQLIEQGSAEPCLAGDHRQSLLNFSAKLESNSTLPADLFPPIGWRGAGITAHLTSTKGCAVTGKAWPYYSQERPVYSTQSTSQQKDFRVPRTRREQKHHVKMSVAPIAPIAAHVADISTKWMQRADVSTLINNCQQLKLNSNLVCAQAISNVEAVLEVRRVRVRGSIYQVPSISHSEKREKMAVHWIMVTARSKKRLQGRAFPLYLGQELLNSLEEQGESIRKRDQSYKVSAHNRAYSRYQWW